MNFIHTRKTRLFKFLAYLMAFELFAFPIFPVFALPEGQSVQHGNVTFEQAGGNLKVFQESNKAIVNYGAFNIGGAESVQFIQPGASSAILNRVIGGSQSTIAGSLSANGQVFLVNPAGILFSGSSQVDVAGLVASAMSMASEDFLAGRMKFGGGNGSVVNQGNINAGGYAYLIGRKVDNSGNIRAGDLVLAAGERSVEIEKIEGGKIRLIIDGVIDGETSIEEGEDPELADSDTEGSDPEEGVLIIEIDIPPSAEGTDETETAASVVNAGTLDASAGDVHIRAADSVTLSENSQLNASTGDSTGGSIDVFSAGDLSTAGTIQSESNIRLEGHLLGGASISSGGSVNLISHSPLPINTDIIAAGPIILEATEVAGGGDTLTVRATVESTGNQVILRAGDNLVVDPGAIVRAATSVTLDTLTLDTDAVQGSVRVNGEVDAGTSLNLLASGNVTSGAGSIITANGKTTIDARSVDLVDTILNGQVQIDADNDASLVNQVGTSLAASTVGRDLNVQSSTGNITDSGAVTVAGHASFTSDASAIHLDQLDMTGPGKTVSLVSANNTSLDVAGNLTLGASNVGRDLDVKSGGDLSGSDLVVIGRDGLFQSSNNIDLSNLRVDRQIHLDAGVDATVTADMALTFGNVNVVGHLDVTATTGDITDASAVAVGGMAQLNATAGSVDADQLDVTGSIGVNTADSATLINTSTVDLKASTVGTDLEVTATTGDLTDSGTVTVGGMAQLNAAAGSVDADQLDVTGSIGLNSLTSADVVNTTAVDLKMSSVGTDLDVTATTGDITDSGLVTVGGMAEFKADAINLDQLDITGPIGLDSQGNVDLVNATGLDLLTGRVVRGDLTATATTGDITDNGAGFFAVHNMAQFNAPAGMIDLSNLSISGPIGLSTPNSAFIGNDDAVNLKASNVDFLSVASFSGNITDSGVVTVNSGAQIAAPFGSINMDQLDATGPLFISAIRDATIVNAGAVDLGVSNVRDLDVTATTGDITTSGTVTARRMAQFNAVAGAMNVDQLNVTDSIGVNAATSATLVNTTDVDLKASTVGTDLDVTATSGDITDSGTVTVGGMAQLNAAAGSVNVDQLDVTGSIGVNSGAAATLVNTTAVDLKASTVGTDLDVTATTGDLTDSGAVSVGGMGQFNAPAGIVNLDQTTVSRAIGFTSLGSITISQNGNIELKTSNIGGDLEVTATAGKITDSGMITVMGMAQFNAATQAIILDQLDVTGAIGLDAGLSSSIVNAQSIELKASSVNGSLRASATTGDITGSSLVTVNGKLTADASAGGIDLTMLDVAGQFDLTALNDATLVNPNSVRLASVDVGGDLDLSSQNGDIIDFGNVSVGGMATFNANNGSINLDTLVSDSLSVHALNGATIVSSETVRLKDSNVNGPLKVTANGPTSDIVNEPGAIVSVLGNTTLEAGREIFVDGLDVQGQLRLDAVQRATAANLGTITLNTTDAGQYLELTSQNGDIVDVGPVVAGVRATFDAPNGSIDMNTLSVGGAGASGLVALSSSGDASVVNDKGIRLLNSAVGGNLDAQATTGNILDEGPIEVAGMAQFTADAGAINLDTLDVDGSIGLDTPLAATVVNQGAIDFKATDVGGQLKATAVGIGADITDSATVNVGGRGTFEADRDTITLDQLNLTASERLALKARDAVIVNQQGVTLGASELLRDVSIQAKGDISDEGVVKAGRMGSFIGDAIDLNSLDIGGGSIGSIALMSTGESKIRNTQGIRLEASSVGADLTATALSGNILDNAPVTVANNAQFNAPAGSVLLDSTEVNGETGVNAGDNADLSMSKITLAQSTVGNQAKLTTTAGNITQTGPLSAAKLLIDSSDKAILNNPANDLGTVAGTSLDDLVVVDRNALEVANPGITSGGGHVRLEARDALKLSNAVDAQGGHVTLLGDSVEQTASGDVKTSGTGTIDVQATGGDIVMANGATAEANRNIIYQADDSITLGSIQSNTGVIRLEATGGIFDGGDAASDLVANRAMVNSDAGIGVGNPLDTELDIVRGESGADGFFLEDQDALTINQVAFSGVSRVADTGLPTPGSFSSTLSGINSGGLVDVRTAAGDLNVNTPVLGPNGVLLEAKNRLRIDAPVQAPNGELSARALDADILHLSGALTGGSDVLLQAKTDVVSLDSIESTGGKVTVESMDAAMISSGGVTAAGDVLLDATGLINLQNDVTSTGGKVTARSQATITQNGAVSGLNDVLLDAQDEIFIRQALESTAGKVTAQSALADIRVDGPVKGAGDVLIDADDAVDIQNSIESTGGKATVLAANRDIEVNGSVTAADDILLDANRSVNILKPVESTGGKVTAQSAMSDVLVGDTVMAAGDVLLDAQGTDVTILSPVTSSAGGVTAKAEGAVFVGGPVQGAADVLLDAKSTVDIERSVTSTDAKVTAQSQDSFILVNAPVSGKDDVLLDANRLIDILDSVTSTDAKVTAQSLTSDITVAGPVSGKDDVLLDANGVVSIDAPVESTMGTVTIDSETTDVLVNAPVTGDQQVTITAENNIPVNNAVVSLSEGVEIATRDGNIDLTGRIEAQDKVLLQADDPAEANSIITVGGMGINSTLGDVILTATGDVILEADITAGHDIAAWANWTEDPGQIPEPGFGGDESGDFIQNAGIIFAGNNVFIAGNFILQPGPTSLIEAGETIVMNTPNDLILAGMGGVVSGLDPVGVKASSLVASANNIILATTVFLESTAVLNARFKDMGTGGRISGSGQLVAGNPANPNGAIALRADDSIGNNVADPFRVDSGFLGTFALGDEFLAEENSTVSSGANLLLRDDFSFPGPGDVPVCAKDIPRPFEDLAEVQQIFDGVEGKENIDLVVPGNISGTLVLADSNADVSIGGSANLQQILVGQVGTLTIGGSASVGNFNVGILDLLRVNGNASIGTFNVGSRANVIIGGSFSGGTMNVGGPLNLQVGGDWTFDNVTLSSSTDTVNVGGNATVGNLQEAGTLDLKVGGNLAGTTHNVDGNLNALVGGSVAVNSFTTGPLDLDAGGDGSFDTFTVNGPTLARFGGALDGNTIDLNGPATLDVGGDGSFNTLNAQGSLDAGFGGAVMGDQANIGGPLSFQSGGGTDINQLDVGGPADLDIGGDLASKQINVRGPLGAAIGGGLTADELVVGGDADVKLGDSFEVTKVDVGKLDLESGGEVSFDEISGGTVNVRASGAVNVSRIQAGSVSLSGGRIVNSGSSINAGSVSLVSGGDIGNGENSPINLNVSQISQARGNNIYLRNSRGGDTLLGDVAAQNDIFLTVPDNLFDLNGDANNLSSSSGRVFVRASGRIGTPEDPLEINIQNTLTISGGENLPEDTILFAFFNGFLGTPPLQYRGPSAEPPGIGVVNGIVDFLDSDTAGIVNTTQGIYDRLAGFNFDLSIFANIYFMHLYMNVSESADDLDFNFIDFILDDEPAIITPDDDFPPEAYQKIRVGGADKL